MKQLIIAGMILLFTVVGCGKFSYMAPEIPDTICSDYDQSTSHIMKVASEYGIEINELYYGLLDATTVGMITDVVDRKAVKNYIETLENFILEYGSRTYTDLISRMISGAEDALLIKNLLHRRIGGFQSDAIISDFDRCLILTGLENAKLELML